jgi:hypothetical protein
MIPQQLRDGLLYQFDRLDKSASALQNQGNQVARIAHSGKENLARCEEAFQVASNFSGAFPAVQEQMDQLVRSLGLQLSSIEAANFQLNNALQGVHVAGIEALTGVTVADIAAQSLIKTMIEEAPDDQKAAVTELTKNPFEHPFSEQQLDNLLGKFRSDLPNLRGSAWFAFYSPSDRALQDAAYNMRDILSAIIGREASNERVQACSWFDSSKKKPEVPDRIRLLVFGSTMNPTGDKLDDMNAQIRRYQQLHEDLNNTAHGSKRLNKEQVRLALHATEELLHLILAQERPN